jgi:hypothetical protein
VIVDQADKNGEKDEDADEDDDRPLVTSLSTEHFERCLVPTGVPSIQERLRGEKM